METWGRLDVCVTNAAVSGPQVLHRTTPENVRAALDVNVLGTVFTTSAALRVMRAAGYGRIVMVSSTAGLHGEPTVSAYAASKGAVIALGRSVAQEGIHRGVHTNVLLPYATTRMTEQGMDRQQAERMRAERVAPVVGALVDPRCTLDTQVVVAGAAGSAPPTPSSGGPSGFPRHPPSPPTS